MEPIISPWLVYLVSFLANVSCVAVIALIVASTVIGLGLIVMAATFDDDEDVYNKTMKIMKIAGLVVVVSGVIVTLIPSKNDMLTMFTLSYITPDNVQLIQGNIVDFVKQIAQAVK